MYPDGSDKIDNIQNRTPMIKAVYGYPLILTKINCQIQTVLYARIIVTVLSRK